MKDWIKAARLRTLPLSLSGIIMGAFIAKWRLYGEGGIWDWRIFALALVVTLLYQILSNYANDYGDGIKGTDAKRATEAEARAVASGKITAKQMRNAVILFSVLSFIATVALLYVAFIPNYMNEFYIFIGLGILSILAAIGYTVGKNLTDTWDWEIFLYLFSSVWFLSAEVISCLPNRSAGICCCPEQQSE
jgi:1,4-dihydroxy-2-naphthoate octaprenyltransferase